MFIDRQIVNQLEAAIELRLPTLEDECGYKIESKGQLLDLEALSSKTIRSIIAKYDPLCVHKFGTILTPSEALTWGENLRKVVSVRHKAILLRVAHGDIYTRSKLVRYGLENDPNCPRCGLIEDLEHKFVKCNYVERIWGEVIVLTDCLTVADLHVNCPIENKILGATLHTSSLKLTIHSDILQRIMSLKSDQNYLMRPKHFVKLALKSLLACEKTIASKQKIEMLLNRIEN